MKTLITGGAGFLGYHLTHYFLKKGQDIACLDIADFPQKDYPSNVKTFNVDVRNKSSLEKVVKSEKPDFIIHAAAALPLWNKKDIFTTNLNGTKNILEVAVQSDIQRIVFISSTAVYGVPEVHPILEEHSLMGVGDYGISKIEAEKICLEYRNKGLIVPIIRPKTFIGPARLGVFEILFDWVHDNKKIPVIGNGKNKYQLLDVEDLCEAIYLTLIKEKNIVNNIFNVGAIEFTTVREDLESFFKKVESKSRIISTPSSIVKFFLAIFNTLKISPLYKWIYDTADKDSFVSTEKIQKTLGWQAKNSNQDSFIRAYDWYLQNYKEIKQEGEGLTHRKAWKQGILRLVKKFM